VPKAVDDFFPRVKKRIHTPGTRPKEELVDIFK
jgi:hypothetical protein